MKVLRERAAIYTQKKIIFSIKSFVVCMPTRRGIDTKADQWAP